MRYIYLANGRVARDILRWLVDQGDRPAGVIVHSVERARLHDDILSIAALPPKDVLEGPALRTHAGLAWLSAHQPDLMLSVHFGYILKPDVLAVPRLGVINLHPGLLPYNRGAYPNVWSIIERTPAGVTLHFVDPGVDTGDIITQREVPVLPTDTGAALYARLEEAAVSLFQSAWPAIRAGAITRSPQPPGGTSHRLADVEHIDRIDPDQVMRAGDLIDILRARTFPPYQGTYLDLGDRRIYLRLELIEEPPA
jgi:methionyl-tRNA formyltransferase